MRSAFTIGTALVVAALVGDGPARAAEDAPDAVTDFGKKLEVEAKTILRFAHPLGTLKKATVGEAVKKGDDYVVPCLVEWTGKEDKKVKEFTTTFEFTVRTDKVGKVDAVVVAVAKDTCPVEAFKGTGLAVRALRVFVKSSPPGKAIEILKPKLYETINTMDAAELLGLYLQFYDRKEKK